MEKSRSGLPLDLANGKAPDCALDEDKETLALDSEWDENSFKYFCADADLHRTRMSEKRVGGLEPWQSFIELQIAALTQEVIFLRDRQEEILNVQEEDELEHGECGVILEDEDFGNGNAGRIDIIEPDDIVMGNGVDAESEAKPKTAQTHVKHGGAHGHHTAGAGGLPAHARRVAEGVEASETNIELPEEYRFHESIWDASLFIGTAPMGHFGSFLLIICLVAQAVMSGGFIYATFDPTFLGGYEDDLEVRLKEWRVNAGHAYSYMSESGGTGLSLVSRVCELDKSLELSVDKVQMLVDIDSYQSIGRVLGLLGVVVWWLVVLNDMNDVWNFIRGVFPIERKQHTDIIFHQQMMKIIALSRPRYMYAFVVMVCRVCMAAALVIAGTLFLMNTLNVAGIILNAISLDVILSLDELLYLALAPAQAKDFMNKLEPLANPPLPRRHGLDMRSAVVYPTMAVAIVFVITRIGATIERLQEYEDAICGGNKLFSYERDRGGMVQWMRTEQPHLPSLSDWESTRDFASYAVWEIIDFGFSEEMTVNRVPIGEELAWVPGTKTLGIYKQIVQGDRQLHEIEWLHQVYFTILPQGSRVECRDLYTHWHDDRGYSCQEYKDRDFCTSSGPGTGRIGPGWSGGTLGKDFGFTALEACCDCGGGLLHGLNDMDKGTKFPTKISSFLNTLSPHQSPPGGLQGAESCKDLEQYCLEIGRATIQEGSIARAFCPRTCGCGALSRGSWNFDYGCHGNARKYYVAMVSDRKFTAECEDEPIETITTWMTFLADTLRKIFPESAVAALLSDGCNAIPQLEADVKSQVCADDYITHKSLLALCPHACGCEEGMSSACPRSCTWTSSALVLSAFGWQGTEKSRVIEVYVAEDVEDMSVYSLGVATNARPDVEQFRFAPTPARQGTYLYLSRKRPDQLDDVFPNIPSVTNHTQPWILYNGNDNIVIFCNGSVMDRYGVPRADAIGQNWQYDIDKPFDVIFRRPGTRPNWFFSRQEWTRETMESFGTFRM